MKEMEEMNLGILCLTVSLALCAPEKRETWLNQCDYGQVSLAIAETASPSQKYAASQFREYWAKCTGYEIPVAATPGTAVTVWIGSDGLPTELKDKAPIEGLEPDGLHIKTVGRNLIIAGGRQRGTMYGVFEFFQRFMGVRWLAPDCTHLPPPPESLPSIDFRYVPPFAWRDINYRPFADPHFAAVHRLNGQFPNLPESMGGHLPFVNGFAHTFHSFISPDEYGKTHPEYFSLVNGERRVERNSTQLCLTNPDVLRIVTEKTKHLLHNSASEHPIVSITQMDTSFWCECTKCAAIDKREGSQSGSVLWFVNQVADAVKEEFPHAYIDTFAYTYTRKPPKHIRPRDNVIVRLCSIECDFARPTMIGAVFRTAHFTPTSIGGLRSPRTFTSGTTRRTGIVINSRTRTSMSCNRISASSHGMAFADSSNRPARHPRTAISNISKRICWRAPYGNRMWIGAR